MSNGVEDTIQLLKDWQDELRLLFTMVGAETIDQLHHHPVILTGATKDWCEARGISLTKYGNRK